MIFDNSTNIFESEKERNLYYKLFAGYLLNELVPGYPNRLQCLCDIINNSNAKGVCAPRSILKLDPDNTHVSFDNHIKQFHELKNEPDMDRGEFADIFIHDNHDKENKVIVTIEAKLHTNWHYDKDITGNLRRIDLISKRVKNAILFPVLLVLSKKWEHAMNMQAHKASNYKHFQDDSKCPFIVITWEQIRDKIENKNVRQFLSSQINKAEKNRLYEFNGDWFQEKLG